MKSPWAINEKVFTDRGRNCVERARVAAVFIALNMPEHPLEPPHLPRPAESISLPSPGPTPSVSVSSNVEPTLSTSLAIGALARFSSTSDQWMLGGSIFGRLQHRAIAVGLELSADSPLQETASSTGTVQATITRLAMQIRCGIVWHEPSVAAGPFWGRRANFGCFTGKTSLKTVRPGVRR